MFSEVVKIVRTQTGVAVRRTDSVKREGIRLSETFFGLLAVMERPYFLIKGFKRFYIKFRPSRPKTRQRVLKMSQRYRKFCITLFFNFR